MLKSKRDISSSINSMHIGDLQVFRLLLWIIISLGTLGFLFWIITSLANIPEWKEVADALDHSLNIFYIIFIALETIPIILPNLKKKITITRKLESGLNGKFMPIHSFLAGKSDDATPFRTGGPQRQDFEEG